MYKTGGGSRCWEMEACSVQGPAVAVMKALLLLGITGILVLLPGRDGGRAVEPRPGLCPHHHPLLPEALSAAAPLPPLVEEGRRHEVGGLISMYKMPLNFNSKNYK